MAIRKGFRYRLRFYRRAWFLTFVAMAALAILAATVMQTTGNQAMTPAALFYGSIAAPLAFAVATHTRTHFATSVPPAVLLGMVLLGGGVALIIGGFFDKELIPSTSGPSILLVGFIEELAKFLPVLALALTGRYLSVRAGVALGFASAFGFAFLESMSYGLQAEQTTNIFGGEATLLISRSITAPFGHLAWTGLLCALAFASWQQRGKATLTGSVIGGYLLVAALHSLFDFTAGLGPLGAPLNILIAVAGYVLFRLATRKLTVTEAPGTAATPAGPAAADETGAAPEGSLPQPRRAEDTESLTTDQDRTSGP